MKKKKKEGDAPAARPDAKRGRKGKKVGEQAEEEGLRNKQKGLKEKDEEELLEEVEKKPASEVQKLLLGREEKILAVYFCAEE